MKKILYFILSALVLILFSCEKNDIVTQTQSPVNECGLQPSHFYGMAYPENSTRGIAQRDRLWYPGSTIKVKLLHDPYNMAEQIKNYAAEWERYADIHFEFIETGNAHVRIGFDWNDERYITWSCIGTDCKMVTNQNEATMSFAYWDSSTEQDMKADVLRAFGQVLGLELEHRHLEFDPGWTNRIASYWEGEIEDIPWENLQQYVFTPLVERDILQTAEYDEESIMIWPFSSRYAKNTARSFNYELSQGDKKFIARLYPKEESPILIGTTANHYVNIYAEICNDIIIDWGDGTIENYSSGHHSFFHEFNNEINTFNIYGDQNAIISLNFKGSSLSDLDLSGCKSLKELGCSAMSLTELNISKNLLLEELYCNYNQISCLDFSNNLELKTLSCSGNLIQLLELSGNTKLTYLSCDNNQLEMIDISQNPELEYLMCGNNLLESLDLSHNSKLMNLLCQNNQLEQLELSNNMELTYLECSGNPLRSLDSTHNLRLTTLICNANGLQVLDITNNTLLEYLSCTNNHLQSLDISNNSNLYSLTCSNNELSILDLSNNPELRYLICTDNQLQSLDFSNNINLDRVNCKNNQLQSLDFTNNISICTIYCQNNPIISDQVSMIALAESLRYHQRVQLGPLVCLYVGNQIALEWVKDICRTKDWEIRLNEF